MIDLFAAYAVALLRELPVATVVVDYFDLVVLVKHGRRRSPAAGRPRAPRTMGRKVDPSWADRRLLLRAGNTLSPNAVDRLSEVLRTDEPTNEIRAAWACKELLRQLLAGDDPPGGNRRAVVAGDRGVPPTRRHERRHRGPQPRHQEDQAGRLWRIICTVQPAGPRHHQHVALTVGKSKSRNLKVCARACGRGFPC